MLHHRGARIRIAQQQDKSSAKAVLEKCAAGHNSTCNSKADEQYGWANIIGHFDNPELYQSVHDG